MKYLDEYRDGILAQKLLREIKLRASRQWVIMEICGGQTHTIMRYGLDELLQGAVEMVHGPGCPVCVAPAALLDRAVELAMREGVILASYGDLLRVPGTKMDLFSAKARGADVRMVYSPLDALRMARQNPERKVIFLAVGFETTAPANAMSVYQARREGLDNFFLLSSHVLVPPAIRSLAASPENRIEGLIAPGHVCAIVGCSAYEFLVQQFGMPIVIGGFEPVDLLQAMLTLVTLLEEGKVQFANEYKRSVTYRGNSEAQRILEAVFEVSDQSWRGLGDIPQSGLRLREEFAAWDADRVFDRLTPPVEERTVCISSEILKGLKKPTDCSAFGHDCIPETPLGAPMVSSEGACSAYYQYRRHNLVAIR